MAYLQVCLLHSVNHMICFLALTNYTQRLSICAVLTNSCMFRFPTFRTSYNSWLIFFASFSIHIPSLAVGMSTTLSGAT